METAPNRYRFLEIDPYRYRYYKSYRYPISCLLPILYRYNLKESANFTDTDIPHIHPTDTDTDSRRLIHTDADPDSYRFFLYRYRVSVYRLIPGIRLTFRKKLQKSLSIYISKKLKKKYKNNIQEMSQKISKNRLLKL